MRMRNVILASVAGFALALAAAFPAGASTITYDFTVTATSGPLDGVTENGTFSYDSSIIVPGERINAAGLLTELDFSWDGIAYNQTTANTGALRFDASGDLTAAFFGTDCGPNLCESKPGTDDWTANMAFGLALGHFGYDTPDGSGLGLVSATLVPELPTWVMALLGFAGLGFAAARRARVAVSPA